jgi:hypothetical protein
MNPQDLDRIRFVTRHFYDLQGLQRVLLGLLCLVVGLATPSPIGLALIALLWLPAIRLSRRARAYYRSELGEVERQAVNPLSPRGQRVVVVLALALVAAWLALAFYLQDHVIQHPAPSPVVIGRFGFLIPGAVSIGIWRWRGSCRWQAHYLVFGLLCLGLAAPIEALRPIQLIVSRREGVWLLLGAFQLVTGLFDHLVLVRTMTRLSAVHGALAGAARAESPR